VDADFFSFIGPSGNPLLEAESGNSSSNALDAVAAALEDVPKRKFCRAFATRIEACALVAGKVVPSAAAFFAEEGAGTFAAEDCCAFEERIDAWTIMADISDAPDIG